MEEIIWELKRALRDITGGGEVWGGRSAEINGRVARLMGKEVILETPKQEYERIAREAKIEGRIR